MFWVSTFYALFWAFYRFPNSERSKHWVESSRVEFRLCSYGFFIFFFVAHLHKAISLDLVRRPPPDPRPLSVRHRFLPSQANSPWQKVRIPHKNFPWRNDSNLVYLMDWFLISQWPRELHNASVWSRCRFWGEGVDAGSAQIIVYGEHFKISPLGFLCCKLQFSNC